MKVTVVGIGPGASEQMTGQAVNALRFSEVIVGYDTYIDLVRPLLPDKRYLSSPMRDEEARCRMAVEEAKKGQNVAVVCSGDPGVYGLAGLTLALGLEAGVPVKIVPGITAACSGAALLGAPLVHDFAVISLSDLLTPWEAIEKRLDAAAAADFVLCLYNPMSMRRRDHLPRACEIILRYRAKDTPCGLAQNIGRDGECAEVLTLSALQSTEVNMFTTVFIGNSQTRAEGNKLITPRGYREVRA